MNGRIAFQVQLTPDAHIQIYTVRPNGHDLGQITNFADADTVRHWSPDGRQILFEIDRGYPPFDGLDEAFWIMDVTGNNRRRIGQCCANPVPSPDGEKFSFVALQDEANFLTALFTANIDVTNPQQLTPFEFGVAVKQDWAPDGRHLVFTKNGIGWPPGISANIATVPPDGTDLNC